jgi:hypothetical protein
MHYVPNLLAANFIHNCNLQIIAIQILCLTLQ